MVAVLRSRAFRHILTTVVLAAILVLVVSFLYARTEQAALTLDMTESRQFSLTPETLRILERVDRPIQITGFYSSAALRFRELDDMIVRLYVDQTGGLIRSVYYNPDDNPALATQFNLTYDGELFVSYLTDDGQIDFSTIVRVVAENNQERNITSALVRLLDINRFTVAYDTTYSDINPFDTTARGFTGIFNGLGANGILTTSLDLAGLAARGADVPEDIDTILLARMRQQLPPDAIAVLARFLERGGSLLILTDADFTTAPFLAEDSLFNAFLWQNFGIRMLDGIAIDTLSNAPNDTSTRAMFRVARAVQIDDSPPVSNGMIIATSELSYAETDFASVLNANQYEFSIEDDIAGPVNLAAWAFDETTGARVVLIGDTDWATNGLVSNPVGNSILFTDAIRWLTGFGEELVFAPEGRATNLPTVFLSTQQLDQIALLTVVVMPAGLLLIGLAVWWIRRRA
ncbi:hypothetical protein FBR00_05270 [Anaerolineae bacterium CFX4]|nr:hypothetical protein [Anaerolineae bacterium CFX4]